MNNAKFEKLPGEVKFAVIMELASAMLGKETVLQQMRTVGPLIADMVGHGPHPKAVAGDAPVPEENFWGGVWRVYECE